MSDEEVPKGLVAFEVVVDRLREELAYMSNKLLADPAIVQFSVEEVQIELQVAVSTAMKGGTKASLYVLKSGAEGTRSHATTQKVTLKLKPTVTEGAEGPLMVGRNKRK